MPPPPTDLRIKSRQAVNGTHKGKEREIIDIVDSDDDEPVHPFVSPRKVAKGKAEKKRSEREEAMNGMWTDIYGPLYEVSSLALLGL